LPELLARTPRPGRARRGGRKLPRARPGSSSWKKEKRRRRSPAKRRSDARQRIA